MSLLAKFTLFGAATLTAFYMCGFLFILIGSPVDQFAAVLDLLRSVAMTTWVVWAVIRTGEKIQKEIQRLRLATFGRQIGMHDSRRSRLTAV